MIKGKVCVNLCAKYKREEMAVNFYIDKRTDKKGEAPIRMSVTIRGARYLNSTGFKINPAKWDTNKQQARKGCSNAAGMTWANINSSLAKIAEHFANYEGQMISTNQHPDTEAIKMEYARHFCRTRTQAKKATGDPGLFECFDIFTKEMGEANSWSKGTRQKFATFICHLSTYNSNISFDDLTEKELTKLLAYYRDEKQMKNVSIWKQFRLLRWFLKWATQKGYNTNLTFQTFTPKLKVTPKKVIFLEWKELMKIMNYEVPKNGTEVLLTDSEGNEYKKIVHDAAAIAKTRDIFCFCCFTSLRYSDAANLKRSDINIKDHTMTITTIKTADTLTIELNKYALSILEKYADSNIGGYVFPHITNQRMNIYIKELCELCEINELITQTYYRGSERYEETAPKYELMGTHAGRRTFICNALMLGIPAEIVMKWTGHSNYRAMKPYIDVTNAAKASAMSKFNEL